MQPPRGSFLPRRKTEKKDAEILAALKRTRQPGEKCGLCGHWSSATEYGVDDRSGYCDRWEKLTDRDYWCEEFISRDQYKKMQSRLAEENEDFIDEET